MYMCIPFHSVYMYSFDQHNIAIASFDWAILLVEPEPLNADTSEI